MHDPLVRIFGTWAGEWNTASILLRLLFAIVCSAVIGCERASKRHSAGLRTFILVTLAGALATMLDGYLFLQTGSGMFVITAASVVAISIISIHSVFYSSKNQIRGLTTSVGLWCAGLVGMAFGSGYYTLGLIGFVALLCTLSWFPAFEVYLKDRSNHFEIHLELKESLYLQDFVSTIRKLGLIIDEIEQNPAYLGSGLSVYSIAISISSEQLKKYKTHREIIEALSTLEYVYHIEEMHG